ncbi:MAG: sigma-70 family RNA polymerase sigma factor [Chloroflexota bacterium]|nr:MAG: RNA polymerase subunit sigma-24 [Chloroflexota bacterium]
MEDAAVQVNAGVADAELIALLREKPSAGVAALYDRYGRLVYAVALRIVRDHGAAEEITQDVFLRCWRAIDRYRPEQGSLAAWLLSIAHNRAIDELRSRRGRELRRTSVEDIPEPVVLDPGFDAALLRGDVRRALEGLPDNQREVVELIYWSGLTRREIAERLQLPLGTVHTRLRLAMDKLRQALGRLSDGE